MEAQKFKHGVEIQVGGLDTTNAQTVAADGVSTVFTADKIVEVTDVDGLGAWILIVEADTGTAAADTGRFVPPGSTTRPFILKAGKLIETSAKINLNTLDVEEV